MSTLTKQYIQSYVYNQLRSVDYSSIFPEVVIGDFHELVQGLSLVRVKEFNYPYIVINPAMFDLFTDREMLAAVSHELGHLFHGNRKPCPEIELFADAQSLRVGGNEVDLLKALIKLTRHCGDNLYEDSDTHPSIEQRAENLGVNLHYLLKLIDN